MCWVLARMLKPTFLVIDLALAHMHTLVSPWHGLYSLDSAGWSPLHVFLSFALKTICDICN